MAQSVRAAALSNYVTVARQTGLDVASTLRKFGLDPRVLNEPDRRLPSAAVAALLEYSAETARCPAFGLLMAESRQLSDFGAVSLLLTHEQSLRDILSSLVRYRNFLNEALVLQIEEFDDVVLVREELIIEGGGYPRQSYELALGVLYRMCCAVLGQRWQPLNIHFAHKAPESLSVHRRVFQSECVFGGEFNGLLCRAGDLDRSNPAADRKLVRYAEQFMHFWPGVENSSTLQETVRAIRMLLPAQQASIVGVAARLGMNVRTLQRRLEQEGGAFGELLHKTRKELAERYLADRNCTLTQAAALLGYGQLSSFSRWFTEEFGESPTKWRRRRAKGAAPMDR
jgi:AraC-like DNA-binding protein